VRSIRFAAMASSFSLFRGDDESEREGSSSSLPSSITRRPRCR
jgi:hypothetical protein